MRFLKSLLRKVLPKRLFKFLQPFYHGALAVLASYYYGRPGFKMRVVGVTGTAGKSSTVRMLAHILNTEHKKCGFITTVSFHDGDRESLNQHGLSMPGGPLLQKQLALMLKDGCKFAIVECTSEGLTQNRHLGVGFKIGVFTNLYPAHTEAHGGFENYKMAKGKLFKGLGAKGLGDSAIVANLDDSHADYFLNFPAQCKIGITRDRAKKFYQQVKVLLLTDIQSGEGLEFGLENTAFVLPLTGEFNAYNAGLAAAAAEHLGVNVHASAEALKNFSGSAGRMEEIKAGQDFRVFVDYAPEPAGMEAALSAVANLPHSRILHVFGSTGGHRDVKKRFEFGKISAAYADEIFITNDDVYDSDPAKIASDIETGILAVGAGKKHQTILDRKTAIGAALAEAKPGDIVIITGKGSEQFLVLPGDKRIFWDERQVVRDLLSTKHYEL